MIKVPNTLQEVFNIVSTHLLTQGQMSLDDSMCMYRSPNGMKCAAGALIPDNEYKPEFEKKLWDTLVHSRFVENKFVEEIKELQIIHDDGNVDPEQCVSFWRRKLIEFAKKYNLTHNIQEV